MIEATHSLSNQVLIHSLGPDGPELADAERIDWNDLWTKARDHCLAPYLHKLWTDSGFMAAIPSPAAQRFSTARSNNAERNHRFAGILEKLRAALEQNDVPILISKGLPVSQDCYRDPGLRVMYDLDLIVKTEHRYKAFEVLRRLGYLPWSTKYHPDREQSLFWQPQVYCWNPEQVSDPDAPYFVELHTKPWDPRWHGFEMECNLDLWQRSRLQQIADIHLRVPCAEQLLAHLAVHYACNVLESNARLMHLLDIILLLRLRGAELDWDLILESIQASGIASFCFLSFDLARRMGDVRLPEEFMTTLRRETPRGILDWLESRGVEDAGAMNLRQPDRSLIYLLHWNMAGGWSERARILLYSVRGPWHEGTGLARWQSLGSRMGQRLKHLASGMFRTVPSRREATSPDADRSIDPAQSAESHSAVTAPVKDMASEPLKMSAKKIFYNTVLQSTGKILSAIIGIITVAVLSRNLGKTGFGEYTTVASFMGLFSVLADLGLYLVMTKEISRTRTDETRILGNVLALRFMSALLLLTAGAVVALFFPYSKPVKQGMFLAIIAFSFMSGTQVLAGLFQKYLIVSQLVISEIIQRLTMLALVVLAAWKHADLLYFVLALSASSAVHFTISLWLARRLIAFRLQFDFVFWKEVLEESWPLALSGALNLVYFRADTLILSMFKTAADVGIYGLPRKIMEVLLLFPALFAALIMPFLARFAYSDWKHYRLYLQKSLDAIFLVIVPMVLVTIFFARPIINLVGGADFPAADSVLRIMIFATAAIYVGLLLGYAVVALGAQRTMLWGYLLGSLSGLGLYSLLVPRFSYFGAAATTVIVQFMVSAYAYFVTSLKAGFFPSFRTLGKALLAAAPVAAFYSWAAMQWSVEAFLGLMIYLAMLLILRAIPGEFIREIFAAREESRTAQQGKA